MTAPWLYAQPPGARTLKLRALRNERAQVVIRILEAALDSVTAGAIADDAVERMLIAAPHPLVRVCEPRLELAHGLPVTPGASVTLRRLERYERLGPILRELEEKGVPYALYVDGLEHPGRLE